MFDPNNPIPTWSVSTMQRVAEEPTLAAAALRYANLGIPVFPCVPGGKQPLTPNGFHDATSVARVVHAWWQRTPDANIGLPTGTPAGVLVVDVDVHAGGSGFAAFERARAEGFGDALGLAGPYSVRRAARVLPECPRSRSSAAGRSRRRTSTSAATAAT